MHFVAVLINWPIGRLFYRWPLCLWHKFKVLPGIYLCYVCFLSPMVLHYFFSPCLWVFFFFITTKILLHTATAAAACWWDRRNRTMTSFKRRPPKRLDDCRRRIRLDDLHPGSPSVCSNMRVSCKQSNKIRPVEFVEGTLFFSFPLFIILSLFSPHHSLSLSFSHVHYLSPFNLSPLYFFLSFLLFLNLSIYQFIC